MHILMLFFFLIIISLMIGYALFLCYKRANRTGHTKDKLGVIGGLLLISLFNVLAIPFLTNEIIIEQFGDYFFYELFIFLFITFSLGINFISQTEEYELNLERQVEEKTKELVTQKMKERDSIEKIRKQHAQELIQGARRISNQIKTGLLNPLKNAKNIMYLIRENPKLSEIHIDSMENNLERIQMTISDIDKKISVGELRIALEDISTLIGKAITSVNPPDNIEVNYDVKFQAVAIDAVKMFLVFENFIENSVEAMPDGGKLTIKISEKDEGITFSISDTGHGIKEEDKDFIFSPFFTTKKGGLGLGLAYCKLGLAYCKDVIMAHGGLISFETSENGTTFFVELPTSNYLKL